MEVDEMKDHHLREKVDDLMEVDEVANSSLRKFFECNFSETNLCI